LALQRNSAAVIIAHNHPLCFVRGVNLGLRLGFGLALCRFNLSHRPGRQGAPLLTRFARSSTRLKSRTRACDGRAAA
jgi:hypothetical protein